MRNAPHIPGIEIDAELGHGAYSAVYRGIRNGTPCAVKIPRQRGRWTRWAYREAVALARVKHPGLPAVIEVGEVGDVPFLAMELVEGETLSDRLLQGPLPQAQAIGIVTRLVEALGAVHDAGLVHRDVKPRNIIIERTGNVRLVDFGFATPTERIAVNDTAGTPGYTAPEQFHNPARVDPRSDLYAVGQVLLECVTGKAPIAGERETQGSRSGDANRVSGTLGALLAGLRARDPSERYPDTRSVLRELELLRAERPILGPGAYEARRCRGVLIGRDADLARFSRVWEVVGAGGAVLTVEGPRGAGKTRLLEAFGDMARESAVGRVLVAQCRDHDAPLAALRRVLESYLATMGRTSRADRGADEAALRTAAAGHLASFAKLIAPRVGDVLGGAVSDVETAPGGFPQGAAELLVRLARAAGPLLVCLDDVHWIDPISRQVLRELARRAETAPLLIVASARRSPGHAPVVPELDGRPGSRIELRPFDDRHVAALVAAHLGESELRHDLARRIGMLGDRTPLGVIDVLGAMLDVGAVRPREGGWAIDLARMDRITLPDGTLALLGRRLDELSAATRRVLQVAALLGTTFAGDLVGRVARVDSALLQLALAEGARAGIVEAGDAGAHRFVHDTARELLAASLEPAERRALHGIIAEAFEGGERSIEDVCAAATHYAESDLGETAARAHRASIRAADVALGRFDNETALAFLELAGRAAKSAGTLLDADFHRRVGEANLRLGVFDRSLEAFGTALLTERDRIVRGRLLGRIAWVHQARANPELAWTSLRAAFESVGARMPEGGVGLATRSLGRIVGASLRRRVGGLRPPEAASRAEGELLCDLHYQNARLGLEYGKPLRMVASAVEGVHIGEALGRSRAHARSRVFYGSVLTVLGLRAAGSKELAEAERMATELSDPVTIARCTQSRAVAAAFGGETERSLELLRVCLDTYGAWLELNEYFHDAASGELLESLRGRASEAWAWLERAIDRQQRSGGTSAAFDHFLIHRVRACLAALGRGADPDGWLAGQLARDPVPIPKGSYYRLLSWGPRARVFVEAGDLGEAFEALVTEFYAEGLDTKKVHPIVGEFHIAVAHGRVHQFLRAPAAERPRRLAAIEDAVTQLRTLRSTPGQNAHGVFVRAFVALFGASPERGQKLLAEAEAVAQREDCPWVLYAIARTRAHRLRDEGKLGAARDQARIAEMLALEHGALPRARWIREEMGLASAAPDRASFRASTQQGSSLSVRQLAGLLRLIQSPDLRPEQQAAAMLDDLLRDLDADRGLVLFRPDANAGSRLVLGRDRRGEDWSDVEGFRLEWLESVREEGLPWPPEERTATQILGRPVDASRLLAVPLFLGDRPVGAICLDRAAQAPAFTSEERELLTVLSRQIPVSLEIAQLFVERDQLHASLQQAQKMEAVGQLAGGIAHDFQHMLEVIHGSLDAIRAGSDPSVGAETAVISDATQRASRLLRQLLSFSRKQTVVQVSCAVNGLIREMQPMLRRVVGERIKVVLKLDPDVGPVTLARSNFDQAMVNLLVNAREAMPEGGTITIATRECIVDEAMTRRGAPSKGPAVQVEVTDTGTGISPEHLHQIFDPFFTTKSAGGGTGIGLTTVYAFVRNSGGHIDVTSSVGQGTTFSMYFPATDTDTEATPAKTADLAAPTGDPPLASSA